MGFALFFRAKEKKVSLRLGHAAALTTIQVVIHYRVAASLQKKALAVLHCVGSGVVAVAASRNRPTCRRKGFA
ncbi:MAG: hypothetical protein J5860_04940, partial [Clostridia bacterium]|nr:hypothetical protein [Clostridia bacterium]